MTRVREEAGKYGPRHGALTGLAATGGVITSAGRSGISDRSLSRRARSLCTMLTWGFDSGRCWVRTNVG